MRPTTLSARHHALLACTVALGLGGCGTTGEREPAAAPQEAPATSQPPAEAIQPDAQEPVEAPPEPAPPPAWTEVHAIESNAGTYLVHVAPALDTLRESEPFQLALWIARKARPNELAQDVALAVDAAMPEHGHGMNRVPRITRGGDGRFTVEGMLLHMPGRWEIYFDVTHGAVTERAQVSLELE